MIRSFLANFLLICLITQDASAQLSNIDGLLPIEGVLIPNAQSTQKQSLKPLTIFKDCNDCPEMVVIPDGSFMMGGGNWSNSPDNIYKFPRHLVSIQTFYLGRYPVKQDEWLNLMGFNPSEVVGPNLPVVNVSWDDAQLFVQRLSQKTGKRYRLPSEAEWEYAARAGTKTPYFKAENNRYVYHWIQTRPVGSGKPNLFGLYDLVGNGWQWTQDCWNWDYVGAPTDGSAWLSGNCSERVMRGTLLTMEHSATRISNTQTIKSRDNSFRVARTP